MKTFQIFLISFFILNSNQFCIACILYNILYTKFTLSYTEPYDFHQT